MYNIDYNHRDTINIQAILKYIEKKYTNLIKKKKQIFPADTSVNIKYMLLTVKTNLIQLILQKILLFSDDDILREALLAANTKNNTSNPKKYYILKELYNLPDPASGKPETKQVNGKTAYYCDFYKTWSQFLKHTSKTYHQKKVSDKSH